MWDVVVDKDLVQFVTVGAMKSLSLLFSVCQGGELQF